MRPRHRADRRHILNLEGIAARAFEIDDAGVGADQRLDAGTKMRVIELGGHAITREHGARKSARRPVDRVAHEQVIARLAVGQQRHRDGRKA